MDVIFNVIDEAKLVINFIPVSVTYAFGNMRQNRQKERQQSENKEEKGYQLIEETGGITEEYFDCIGANTRDLSLFFATKQTAMIMFIQKILTLLTISLLINKTR